MGYVALPAKTQDYADGLEPASKRRVEILSVEAGSDLGLDQRRSSLANLLLLAGHPR